MQQFPNKENPKDPNAFSPNIKRSKELIQKELDINRAEQNLLTKRIALMQSLCNDLPDYDPHYSMMRTQIKMDQIELDELKVREAAMISQLDPL